MSERKIPTPQDGDSNEEVRPLEELIRWAETNARSCEGDDSAPFVAANEVTWRQVAGHLRHLLELREAFKDAGPPQSVETP